MRTISLVLLTLALAGTAPAGTTRATLRVVDSTPLTVRGAGFAAERPVRLAVAQAGQTLLRRTVRTGRLGGFTAVLSTPAAHRCGADLAITARDGAGRLARAKLPLPDCPPPLAP